MPLDRKENGIWERLYLGKTPFWTTYAFWQYVGAFAFPAITITESLLRVKSRRPHLFATIWPLFALMEAGFVYLTWRHIEAIRGQRIVLRAAEGSREYSILFEAARAKTRAFIRMAFIYGGAVIVLEILAMILTH